MAKTREEVEALKADWLKDPIWDIEDTEGFEDHHDELKAFHDQMRKEWTERAERRWFHQVFEASAFPLIDANAEGWAFSSGGLTKREYFAGLALMGTIAESDVSPEVHARYAVRCADALIIELMKRPLPETPSS